MKNSITYFNPEFWLENISLNGQCPEQTWKQLQQWGDERRTYTQAAAPLFLKFLSAWRSLVTVLRVWVKLACLIKLNGVGSFSTKATGCKEVKVCTLQHCGMDNRLQTDNETRCRPVFQLTEFTIYKKNNLKNAASLPTREPCLVRPISLASMRTVKQNSETSKQPYLDYSRRLCDL